MGYSVEVNIVIYSKLIFTLSGLYYFALSSAPEKSRGMADKPEMELGLASDCAWVRALDASGNSIRIAKADMAELIRKEMPVATSERNGLMSKGDKILQTRYIEGKGYHRISFVTAHFYHAVFIITSTDIAGSIPSTRIISFKGNESVRVNTLFTGMADCKMFKREIGTNTECWIYLKSDGESFAYVTPFCNFGATFDEVFSETLPDNSTEIIL